MKTRRAARVPYGFVLDELTELRPETKTVFGSTHVYIGDRLLLSLHESVARPGTNGVWVYTTVEHVDSLGREFDMLPKRNLWRSGKNAWVVLAARLPGFEEWTFRVCELIREGDRRIGRASRRR